MFLARLRRIMDYSEISLQRELSEIRKKPIRTKEERRKVHFEMLGVCVMNAIVCFSFFWMAIAEICVLLWIFNKTWVVISSLIVIGVIISESFDFRSKQDAGKMWAERNRVLDFIVLPICERFFEEKLEPEVFLYTGQEIFKENGYYFSLPRTIRDSTQAFRLKRMLERRLADQNGMDINKVVKANRVYVDGSVIFIRR